MQICSQLGYPSEVLSTGPLPNLETVLWRGQYPALWASDMPPALWMADYVATYVERDLRQLVNVRDLSAFQRFLRMCAAPHGADGEPQRIGRRLRHHREHSQGLVVGA